MLFTVQTDQILGTLLSVLNIGVLCYENMNASIPEDKKMIPMSHSHCCYGKETSQRRNSQLWQIQNALLPKRGVMVAFVHHKRMFLPKYTLGVAVTFCLFVF